MSPSSAEIAQLGLTSVPRLWPGEPIVCIGAGPSVTQSDIDYCRGRARVLVINNMYQYAPWADALFAADEKWWRWHRDAVLPPLLFTVAPFARQLRPDVHVLNYTGEDGLERSPAAIRTGGHGGFAAINVAYHLTGGPKIVLLGYDVQPDPVTGQHHVHADHPDGNHLNYAHRRGVYHTLIEPCRSLGVSIINASRRTTITAFPCLPVHETLS